jgi:Family of unknown function (DUF6600)
MKWLSIALLVMAVFVFSPMKSAEAAAFSFSVGFHDELSPYGTWVNFSNYGNVWRPYAYAGWRPYMDGYWGYTNYGPSWYGNEPYAPYVYNYGQWIFTPAYGWVWIPGNAYHAAAVDWTYGGGYIGWRPMFPSGYYYNGPDYNFWTVIPNNAFGYQSYRSYALPVTRVRDLFGERVFRTRLNRIDRVQLERIVRRPIRVQKVVERDVLIGGRKARLITTPDQEVRIRKHVTEVRGGDREIERNTPMNRKFEDIRSKSSKSKDFRNENSVKSKDFNEKEIKSSRSNKVETKNKFETKQHGSKKVNSSRKPEKQKVEKKPIDHGRNSNYSAHKIEKADHGRKSNVSAHRIEKSSSDRGQKSTLSAHRSEKSNSGHKSTLSAHGSEKSNKGSQVRNASFSSRQPAKVEKASFQKTDRGKTANVKRTAPKREKPHKHY